MIACEEIVAVLLCAGLSRRFGDTDKLMHPLAGRPLVSHAAAMLRTLPFKRRIAVVQQGARSLQALLRRERFDIVVNAAPERGQDQSLALSMIEALGDRPTAVLVALGDMPFIEAEHLLALAAVADTDTPAVSFDGKWAMPPSLFPTGLLTDLASGREKRTLRQISKDAALVARVPTPQGMLVDFDTEEDFRNATA